jgi:hypothetical protein
MSEKKAVLFADDKELFLIHNETIERDKATDLPLNFLFALYQHGYEIVEEFENKTGVNPFFIAAAHQMGRYGVDYSGPELRSKVIEFEKENVESLRKFSGLLTPRWHKLDEMMEETVEGHILHMEKNKMVAELFDYFCTARFLGVEMCVFSPDYESELVLNRFNEKGGKMKRCIAVVLDSSRRPVRLFSTSVVHKHNVLDNPYYVLLKKRKLVK